MPFIQFDAGKEAQLTPGSLQDYLGIPTGDGVTPIANVLKVNGLPWRAYAQIYNDYYRDQNLTPAINFSKGDGEITESELLSLRKRAWEKVISPVLYPGRKEVKMFCYQLIYNIVILLL